MISSSGLSSSGLSSGLASSGLASSESIPEFVPVCLNGYTRQTNFTFTTNDGQKHNSKCILNFLSNTKFTSNDINNFISTYQKYYNYNTPNPIFTNIIISNGASFNQNFTTTSSPVVHNFICNINNSLYFNLKYYSSYTVIFAYSDDVTKYNTYSIQTINNNYNNIVTTNMKSSMIDFIQNNIPRAMNITNSIDLTSDNTINIDTIPYIIINNIQDNSIINIKTFSNTYLPIIIDNSSVIINITFL